MTTTIEDSKYPDDIMNLELTDEIKSIEIISNFMSSFSSKSVIVQLNLKYDNNIIELPVILEDWNLTNERFDGILKNKEVTDEDRIKLLRLLNYNANRITDHFSERTLAHMDAGRRAKMERIESAKTSPPVEVTISQALRMHEGNIRVKGMISAGSDKIEKMITRVFFRCGECDALNELAGYRDSRPRFAYEVPTFNLKEKKCIQGCESFGHELHEEVINAYRIELQETETFNDLDRLPVILFEDCIKKDVLGEQVIVTGSVHRIRIKNRLLTYLLVGLDPKSTLEYEHKKESDELTAAELEEFQELARSTKRVRDIKTGKEMVSTVLDELVSKFAPSIIGLEHVKRGLLLCVANSGKDTYQRKLRINALMIEETGLDKSALLRAAINLVNNSRFLSSLNSSIKSQVGIIDKEDDRVLLRLGPIPRAAGAICTIDEIGRMRPEDQEQLLHALQEGKMPFVKHGFDLMLDGRATFIMSSNPKNPSGDWHDKDKISLNEIPLLGPLRDRVGLIFVFRANRQVGYVADYAFKKAKIINDTDAVNKEEEKNYNYLRKYILYCKRFCPTLSKEAEVMIVQYYVNIMIKPESRESPRLFDTLTSLCFAVARLKQKSVIEFDDVMEVTEFYNEQLLHLSQLVSIPRDPRDLAYEEIINAFSGLPFKHDFIELVKTVRKTNVFVREYIGDNLRVSKNRKLREIRDRFVKLADERILILSFSPLVLAWKDSYKGGDIPIHDSRGSNSHDEDGHDNNIVQEESAGKMSESDTSDTSDNDKKCSKDESGPGPKAVPDNQVTSIGINKDTMSDVIHVTHVTPAEATAGLASEKERDRCKQSSLTDEQINIFYQVFNELENASNQQPGSFSSDDKGTVGREELKNLLMSVEKLTANDADWIVVEMQRIGNIKEVIFDTFRRTR